MEQKIQELKKLRLAHLAALEYDYCPSAEEASNIIKELEGFDDIGVDDLGKILTKNEGASASNIEEEVFLIIKDL